MKLSRNNIFIIVSSIALLVVLIIQVNWISQTAKYKEESFNEKANIILARTTEALFSDKEICKKLENGIGTKETRKIDSLLKKYMKFYNFHADYSFEIIKSTPFFPLIGIKESRGTRDSNKTEPACYEKSLNEMANRNGWTLKLNFPKREEFIMREMGMPFITSVILILIVLFLFWRTVLSLMKEKKISEHTADFLNNMTHEFKTPLASIALAGKMIMKDAIIKQENEIRDNSGIILEENEKLRLQVEQVLSITALESGEIPIQKTELDFHQLIQDCLKSINIQIANKEMDLRLNLGANRFVVMGDKTHLTNAVRNLVDNALKYSKNKPQLLIETHNVDKSLVVEISDKGIGIEKEYQKKVFKKYFRVPKGDIHNVRGFGLGLAYVKKIVELHGGTIELESEKEKGTTITIILPND
jgi:two-component system phosphate regulon sensor histidine kinase PhoR